MVPGVSDRVPGETGPCGSRWRVTGYRGTGRGLPGTGAPGGRWPRRGGGEKLRSRLVTRPPNTRWHFISILTPILAHYIKEYRAGSVLAVPYSLDG